MQDKFAHLGSHSNESPWHCIHEVILLSEQRHDPGVDWLASQLALAVLGHQSWSDLNLLPNLENSSQDRSSSNSSTEVFNITTRFVHIKTPMEDNLINNTGLNAFKPDDDQPGLTGEVSDRHGDLLHDVLAHDLNVVLQLG
jgi:hypothetical protein